MIEIIYEDNHLLVLNKPAGMLTQPSGTEQMSLEEMAKQWIKQRDQKPGNVFLHAVHRLDKPVSGLVLFAKTSKALSRLQAEMRHKNTKKVYIALVEGVPPSSSGVLEHYLSHDDHRATVRTTPSPDAKLARLSYRIIKTKDQLSLIEIILETGRYHQIRAQFAAIGCPIVGDHKYGSHATYQPDAIALHHARLEIAHPITKELQVFEVREDFS